MNLLFATRHRLSLLASVTTIFLPSVLAAQSEEPKPVAVHLERTADGYQLIRDGKPYFIRGAGGDGSLALLARSGGNSLRTWGADHLQAKLDEAQGLGLTVAVGIWLGHERHGFDYNNADQVATQFQEARRIIERYKNHPAVLLWGLGNEMEGYERADNAAVWSAVNSLAALAKQLDPNHPTMTVVAEIGGDRVKNVHRLCPNIDILGINSYGGAATLARRYAEASGEKPFIVTEFGPPGVWESPKNTWGVSAELTSTEKAAYYRRAYEQSIMQPGKCLGSYVFAWGHKQEATATWFGMLLPDGSKLAAVDAMAELWSGKAPANRCPVINELRLKDSDEVEPGATVHAELESADPEGEKLSVRWLLCREAEALGTGGDAEATPEAFADALTRGDDGGAEIKMPAEPGGYRLFVYVYDGQGGAAVANVPLLVKGQVAARPARKAVLPLVIYDEAGRDKPAYVPTGWMGETKQIGLAEDCDLKPHGGKTCIRAEYRAAAGWGGVVWQHPANNWGDKPGGWNLSGATRLTFWARGERGDETVSFQFGLLGADKRYRDTARGQIEKARLTNEWKQYSIDLSGLDLARVVTGFAWVVAGQGEPVTFYLDDIRYE
ncbi:MAG TPA: glycoside hydrolase family 2 TIM barrel-domain containing protein [Pirellulales bacterium]|nr:glycoside hydrolase family 2 TIM barrel-domain containing protein [Pirellulales bacterium]